MNTKNFSQVNVVNTTQTDPPSPFQIDPLKTDVTFRYNWV